MKKEAKVDVNTRTQGSKITLVGSVGVIGFLKGEEEDFEDSPDPLPALVSFSTIFTSVGLIIKFRTFLEKINRTFKKYSQKQNRKED